MYVATKMVSMIEPAAIFLIPWPSVPPVCLAERTAVTMTRIVGIITSEYETRKAVVKEVIGMT